MTKYTKETVHDLANHVRETMLKALKEMDAQADLYDTTSIAATQPSSSLSSDSKPGSSMTTASNASPSSRRAGLGGVARLMSYIVGVGEGHNAERDAKRSLKALEKEGLGGGEGKPQDFGLVSEGANKGESSAVAGGKNEALKSRRQGTSGSGSSEEVDEDGNVIVKKP